jgi:hypothetical protein
VGPYFMPYWTWGLDDVLRTLKTNGYWHTAQVWLRAWFRKVFFPGDGAFLGVVGLVELRRKPSAFPLPTLYHHCRSHKSSYVFTHHSRPPHV